MNRPTPPRPDPQAAPGRANKAYYFSPAVEPLGDTARLQGEPALFSRNPGDETKGRSDETIFGLFQTLAKNSGNFRFVLTNQTTRAAKARGQGTVMIKTLSAIAIAAFIAAALAVLPGFAPQVEASVPQALAKGDRLDIRPIGRDCSQQAWPHFEASCLRGAGSRVAVREARLVTADRTP
jgi:hypothetical protein